MFDFISDMSKIVTDAALSPIRDGVSILEGLSEGELRTKAAARFGVDVVAGMGAAELIELLTD